MSAPGPYGVADWHAPLTEFEQRAGVVAPEPAPVVYRVGNHAAYPQGDTDAERRERMQAAKAAQKD